MLFGVYAAIILCSYRGNPAVLCAAAMTSVFDPSLHPAAPMLLMSLAQKDSQVEISWSWGWMVKSVQKPWQNPEIVKPKVGQ